MRRPNYRLDKCNILGCHENAHKLLLCERHFSRYITDRTVTKLQTLVERRAEGREPFRGRLGRWFMTIIHYTVHTRVCLVEHFPLETLFLYHWWLLQRQLRSLDKAPDGVTAESDRQVMADHVSALSHDFGYRENVNVPWLNLLESRLRGCRVSTDAEQYDVTRLIPPLRLLRSPGRYAIWLVIALSVLVIARVIALKTGFRIIPLFNLAPLSIGALLIAGYGWGYSVLRFLQAIPPATTMAIQDALYDDPQANRAFLDAVFYVRARLERAGELMAAALGSVVFLVVGNVLYTRLANRDLSALEVVVSGVINVPAAFVAVSLFMTYPVFVEVISLVWRVPKHGFRVRLYDLDGRLGLGYITDLNTPYLIANLTLFLVVALVIPVVVLIDPPVLLVLGLVVWASLRLFSIRRSIAVIRGAAKEVKTAVQSELRALDKSSSFVDQKAKYDFIRNVKYTPFDTKPLVRLVRFMVGAVLIPVAITLAERHWVGIVRIAKGLFHGFGTLAE